MHLILLGEEFSRIHFPNHQQSCTFITALIIYQPECIRGYLGFLRTSHANYRDDRLYSEMKFFLAVNWHLDVAKSSPKSVASVLMATVPDLRGGVFKITNYKS
jgi:hypothetical protein